MEQRKRLVREEDSSPTMMKKARFGYIGQNRQLGQVPNRFMFLEGGAWKDFPAESVSCLREAYLAGKDAVRIGYMFIVSFLQMLQIDVQTGYRRSIAWIDESGKFVVPSQPVEGPAEQKQLSDKIGQASFSASQGSSASSTVTDLTSVQKGSGQSEVTSRKNSKHAGNKLYRLDPTDTKYEAAKQIFMEGLGMLSTGAQVTGVYAIIYQSASGLARKESFLRRSAIIAEARGSANMRYAWYSCSKEELLSIVQHGFGRPTSDSTYGVGIYLSPASYSQLSCTGADVDDKGDQYLLLCRVILGRSELVQAGSTQFHPSSSEYDTGVDSLVDPKCYIVWSTHMNTNVLPVNIISFKARHEILQLKNSSSVQMTKETRSKLKVSNKLLSALKSELPASKMSIVEQEYVAYRNGELSQKELVKKVRAVAGDEKLKQIVQQLVTSGLVCSLFLTIWEHQSQNRKMQS